MCSFAELQTDLLAADLYWGSEACIRRTKTECNSMSLKGCCCSAWCHLYMVKLWTDHIHLCSTRLFQSNCFWGGHPTRGLNSGPRVDPYHWTTSLALLPYLFSFKRLNIQHFCILLGVKREWTNKALPLLPNNRGYMLLQKETQIWISELIYWTNRYARIPIKGN